MKYIFMLTLGVKIWRWCCCTVLLYLYSHCIRFRDCSRTLFSPLPVCLSSIDEHWFRTHSNMKSKVWKWVFHTHKDRSQKNVLPFTWHPTQESKNHSLSQIQPILRRAWMLPLLSQYLWWKIYVPRNPNPVSQRLDRAANLVRIRDKKQRQSNQQLDASSSLRITWQRSPSTRRAPQQSAKTPQPPPPPESPPTRCWQHLTK